MTNIQKKINDNRDPRHHDHDHPNLVEGDRLQFTSEGKGGVAPSRFLSRYLLLLIMMMMFKIMMMMTLMRMVIKSVTGPLFIQILEALDENSDDDN